MIVSPGPAGNAPQGAGTEGHQARHDRCVDWYEQWLSGSGASHARRVGALLAGLLEAGPGRCLDVDCGTGFHAGLLTRRGWTPIGVDLSLRV